MAGQAIRPPTGPVLEKDGTLALAWAAFFQQVCDSIGQAGNAGPALVAHDAALANHETRIAALEARP